MPVPSTPPRSGESTLERAFRPPPGLPEPSVAECFVPPESEDDIAASSACPLARMREAVSRIGFGAEALQRRAENYRVPFFGTRVSTSNAGPVLNLNPAEHISQVYEVGFEERAGRSEFVSLVASSLSELTVNQLFDKLQAQVKYGPGREALSTMLPHLFVHLRDHQWPRKPCKVAGMRPFTTFPSGGGAVIGQR